MEQSPKTSAIDFDYIVIGSGFGGSVSAMRLAEKGYSVLVLEKGKRWAARDFPKTNWNLRKYLWIPMLRFFGFLKLDFFSQVFVLSGVGVGGGSLVYANTHMMPKEPFYHHPGWSDLADWKKILPAFFERAKFMLGSSRYEKTNVEDDVLAEVARDLGREKTYSRVDYVGVYLGDPARSTDPYFSGLGPTRKGCTECAGCMVGCRHEAKNTLDKNYLWFAEHMFNARIEPQTEVHSIEFSEKDSVYTVKSLQGLGISKKAVSHTAKGVVVSAGVLGTLRLLLKQKYVLKTMTGISDALGDNLMTNSEMLSGVVAADRKLNHGLAISSIFDPDPDTHIELVKFPDHSGSMLRLAVQAAGPGSPPVRIAKMLGNILLHPLDFIRSVFTRNPARNSVILLIMQTLHSSMKMGIRKGITGWKLFIRQEKGAKVPSYIEAGQDVLYRYAKKVNGVPQNAITEVTFGLSSTAHILGGCPPGHSPDHSVVDHRFRVHGYPNMMILDGSIVPCNLGVNPSLTITALSEYAMSCVPPKEGVQTESLDKRLADRRLQTTL